MRTLYKWSSSSTPHYRNYNMKRHVYWLSLQIPCSTYFSLIVSMSVVPLKPHSKWQIRLCVVWFSFSWYLFFVPNRYHLCYFVRFGCPHESYFRRIPIGHSCSFTEYLLIKLICDSRFLKREKMFFIHLQ